MHLSITVWCRSVFPLRCLVQIPIVTEHGTWGKRSKGHTLTPSCLNMTQHQTLLPTKILGSGVPTVSIWRYGIPLTYAFISFFATARNDTVPWLSLSILNRPTPRRKFIAFSRVLVSGTIASDCLTVITWEIEINVAETSIKQTDRPFLGQTRQPGEVFSPVRWEVARPFWRSERKIGLCKSR